MSKKLYFTNHERTVYLKKTQRLFQGGEWVTVPSIKIVSIGGIFTVYDEFAQEHGFKDAQELHDKLVVTHPGFKNGDFREMAMTPEQEAAYDKRLTEKTQHIVTGAKSTASQSGSPK